VTLKERISAFHQLGDHLRNLDETNRHSLLNEPRQFNAWFTPEQVNLAIANVSRLLQHDNLLQWTKRYEQHTDRQPADVGVVMAGNIPLVGFHDLLTVLITGNRLIAKPSTQDTVLIRYMIDQLNRIQPAFSDMVDFRERLNDVDAVIATGSDNTSRYFEYYFRNIPHLIRKNRSSCAILTGDETEQDIVNLGLDIFSFYGLGCRNVSKIFAPDNYDVTQVFKHWETSYADLANHHKYANNYDYNKSIMLVNGTKFLDAGFVMMTESQEIVSPISVLFYERYADTISLEKRINESKSKIQCVVGGRFAGINTVPFGKAQYPDLEDYADGVDTMEFLTRL
jgi:hypothetical protein